MHPPMKLELTAHRRVQNGRMHSLSIYRKSKIPRGTKRLQCRERVGPQGFLEAQVGHPSARSEKFPGSTYRFSSRPLYHIHKTTQAHYFYKKRSPNFVGSNFGPVRITA